MKDDAGATDLLGLYLPTSARDASSCEHNGSAYTAVNALTTTNGPTRVEICLVDGQWIIADPDDLVPGFCLDTIPDHIFIAQHYGDRRGGWDTPVVDRFTLQALLDATEEPHRWQSSAVWIADDDTPIHPDAEGLYDLGTLGWTFLRLNP